MSTKAAAGGAAAGNGTATTSAAGATATGGAAAGGNAGEAAVSFHRQLQRGKACHCKGRCREESKWKRKGKEDAFGDAVLT
jgi:hypothetical protein